MQAPVDPARDGPSVGGSACAWLGDLNIHHAAHHAQAATVDHGPGIGGDDRQACAQLERVRVVLKKARCPVACPHQQKHGAVWAGRVWRGGAQRQLRSAARCHGQADCVAQCHGAVDGDHAASVALAMAASMLLIKSWSDSMASRSASSVIRPVAGSLWH